MKLDLLLSDITALLAGIVGLLASYLLAVTAFDWFVAGDMVRLGIVGGAAVFAFAMSMSFLMPGTHERLLQMFAPLWRRVVFVVLALAWMAVVAVIVLAMEGFRTVPYLASLTPEQIGWGLLGFAALFALVFLVPGMAFRPYKAPRPQMSYVERASFMGQAETVGESMPRRVLRCLFGLYFLAVLGGYAYVMTEAQFLPSPAHAAWVNTHAQTLMIGAAVFSTLALIVMRLRPGRGLFASRIIQKVALIGVFGVFSLLVPGFVTAGAPALYSLAIEGTPAEMRVRVDHQGVRIKRRGCNRRAHVRQFGSGDVHMLCDVPEEIWTDLSRGQVLLLTGHSSDYGFRYETISRPQPRF